SKPAFIPLRGSSIDIHPSARWKQSGFTVAGGNGQGDGINQLSNPLGCYVDDGQTVYVGDQYNHRIVECKSGKTSSQVVADGNAHGRGLTMDENPSLYVVDYRKAEVRRYRRGESQGTVVAGGNGSGNRLDQLCGPHYVFVDRDHSVFVSDYGNHRVMK
ncbi:unnamed protein product, partial [Rotaria magnacalcarata]